MIAESTNFWGPLVAGGTLIVLGLVHLLKYRDFRRHAQHTDGIVVDLRCEVATQAGQIYYPVLEFRTRAGEAMRATSRVGSSPVRAGMGERVTVRYDPRDPQEVEIVGTGGARLALLCLLVLGGAMMVGLAWL
jgi:hypothetical protein